MKYFLDNKKVFRRKSVNLQSKSNTTHDEIQNQERDKAHSAHLRQI